MSKTLQKYIDRYGPEAGPKLFHVLKSRAGHKGVSTRLRHQIEHLTGRPYRLRRKPEATGQLTLPWAEPEPVAVGADSSPSDFGQGAGTLIERGEYPRIEGLTSRLPDEERMAGW